MRTLNRLDLIPLDPAREEVRKHSSFQLYRHPPWTPGFRFWRYQLAIKGKLTGLRSVGSAISPDQMRRAVSDKVPCTQTFSSKGKSLTRGQGPARNWGVGRWKLRVIE